jgi:hypothetical protein
VVSGFNNRLLANVGVIAIVIPTFLSPKEKIYCALEFRVPDEFYGDAILKLRGYYIPQSWLGESDRTISGFSA